MTNTEFNSDETSVSTKPQTPPNPDKTNIDSTIKESAKLAEHLSGLASNFSDYLKHLSNISSFTDDAYASVFSGNLGQIICNRLGSLNWFTTFSNSLLGKKLMPRVVSATNFISHKIKGNVLDVNFKGLTMFYTGNSACDETLTNDFYTPSVTNAIHGVNYTKMSQSLDQEVKSFDPGFHRMVKRDPHMNHAWVMHKYISEDNTYISWFKEAWCHSHVIKSIRKNYITKTVYDNIKIDKKSQNDAFGLSWKAISPSIPGDATADVMILPADKLHDHLTSIGYDHTDIYVSKAKSQIDFIADIYAIWAGRIKEHRIYENNKLLLICAFLTSSEISKIMSNVGLQFNNNIPSFNVERTVHYLHHNSHFGSIGIYAAPTLDTIRAVDLIAFQKFRYSHSGQWRKLTWMEDTDLKFSVPIATWWARLAQTWNIIDYSNDHEDVILDCYQLEDYAWYRGGALGSLIDFSNQIVCGHHANIPSLNATTELYRFLNMTINLLLNMTNCDKYKTRPTLFRYDFKNNISSSETTTSKFFSEVKIEGTVLRWKGDTDPSNGEEWYEKCYDNVQYEGIGSEELTNSFIIMTRADFVGALGEHFGRLLNFGELNEIDYNRQLGYYEYKFVTEKNDVSTRNLIWKAVANNVSVNFAMSTKNGPAFRRLARSFKGKEAPETVFEIPHLCLGSLTSSFLFKKPIRQFDYVPDRKSVV